MSHLQSLISCLQPWCEVRVATRRTATEISLWTHPEIATGQQHLINQTQHPSAEIAALDILDQLATQQ